MATTRRVRIGWRIAAALSTAATVALWLFSAFPLQASVDDRRIRLSDGAFLGWTISQAMPSPTLGLAAPSVAEWSPNGIAATPIALHSNYAAFIEEWELTLRRSGDERGKHPAGIWRGTGATLNDGVTWDGSPQTGPALRPGETLIAVLRVRDLAGNIDETAPQSILISRYLMKKDRRRLDTETQQRIAALETTLRHIQEIPVSGSLLDVRVSGSKSNVPLRLSGLIMDYDGDSAWRLSQIVPPGVYSLAAQSVRPIIGGERLVTEGRLAVTVHGPQDLFVTVKGAGALHREPHDVAAGGLHPDGIIAGKAVARLSLWDRESQSGRLARAAADPRRPALLYRDADGRNVLRVAIPPHTLPWAEPPKPIGGPRTVKLHAHYPARAHRSLTLPHTDVIDAPFRVAIRIGRDRITMLRPRLHYSLHPQQGRILFNKAGQTAIEAQAQSAGAEEAILEVTYAIAPSLAGLVRPHQTRTPHIVKDSGEALHIVYGGAPEPAQGVVLQAPQHEQGWIARNFGWLLGGG